MEYSESALKLAQLLKDAGAKNIEILDVTKKTEQVKYIIISSCASEDKVREVNAYVMANAEGYTLLHKDGITKAQWVVLDYKDYLVEIFTEPLREKYNLEKLWKDGKNKLKLEPEKTKTSKKKIK